MSKESRLTIESLTMWLGEEWFPFVEDENLNIFGPGHQDKDIFALTVTNWEYELGVTEYAWSAEDIKHTYVKESDGYLKEVPQETQGAFPVTCIWGQR